MKHFPSHDARYRATGRRVPLGYFLLACSIALIATSFAAVGWMRTPAVIDSTVAISDNPIAEIKTILLAGGYSQALPRLQSLADEGNVEAQRLLGDLYRSGRGVVQDLPQAFELMLAAAEQNDPAAQNQVAEMYAYGYGVKKDFAKASAWAARALENGYQSTEDQPSDEAAE